MPLVRFAILVVVLFFAWLALVHIFNGYGAGVGLVCLGLFVFVGRKLSKRTLAKLQSRQQ
ncbi:hypothetical protein BCT58_18055 [Vibrio lentus]|jgi:hypothetical protein|nr:hypothetical protein BCT58_18055 [Vibrio lentus]PMM65953.1 hypothetical protein BCT48_18140 [Vibrio sp. 10N.261.46.F12]